MRGKLLLVFALAGLAIAGVKTYAVSLVRTTMVGNTSLQEGKYRIQLDGSQVVFKDLSNRTAAQTSVKIDNAAQKFQSTEVRTHEVGGKDEIEQIRLGGTTTILQFAK